jgi:hypothetical protein
VAAGDGPPVDDLKTERKELLMSVISRLPKVDNVPVLPALPAWLAFTQGRILHVRPKNGSDTNDGKSPLRAFKSLSAALAAATANQNDIVLLYAEGNAAADTSDYQEATLDWNKDQVHLIGVNAGVNISPRARVAFKSTYAVASNLFTLSANGCYIAHIEFFAGVASALPTGCVNVAGQRNRFESCHIAGIGNDANDIAGAYSLRVAGSENEFIRCTIGLDTIARGTGDNCEILLAGGARNKFVDCDIITFAEVNTHQFLKRAAAASDRFTMFRNCAFVNAVQSTGVSMLEALDVTAGGSPGGLIYLHYCGLVGAAEWEAQAGASGVVYVNSGAASAGDGGVAAAVTGA